MNWNIVYHNGFISVRKRDGGKYTLEQIKELSKKYKYIYKASRFFSYGDYELKYSKYIFTDTYIIPDVFKYLNRINVFVYINEFNNIITLYNIKEKIEIL